MSDVKVTEYPRRKKNFFKKVGNAAKEAGKAVMDFCDEHPGFVICALTGGLYVAATAIDIAQREKHANDSRKIEISYADTIVPEDTDVYHF